MNQTQINKIASQLVETTINLHNKKTLSKYSLNNFFKEYLKDYLKEDYYNSIIIKYCSVLAKRGYEIMLDTERFEIIDYNSYEYENYVNKILESLPKNYDELQRVAKKTAEKIIKRYNSKKYINYSFKDYLESSIPNSNYTSQELVSIEVGTVHFITQYYYDINNTNPLILSKFY